MKLILPPREESPEESKPLRQISRDGAERSVELSLAAERAMTVWINGLPVYELSYTPSEPEELVLGRLLSEGVIRSAEEVEQLYICKDGLRAELLLPGREAALPTERSAETVPSCCTGNRRLSSAFPPLEPLRPVTPIPWDRAWIFAMADVLDRGLPIHRGTKGTHGCLLLRAGEILVSREDLSRHNALDKVLGWALLHGVPLTDCLVYTSGRVPVDMVEKLIRARVPVMVSKAMPTDRAAALAAQYGLTLIVGARPDRMLLATGE